MFYGYSLLICRNDKAKGIYRLNRNRPRFHWVGEQPKLPFFVPHIQQESELRHIGLQTASYYAVN